MTGTLRSILALLFAVSSSVLSGAQSGSLVSVTGDDIERHVQRRVAPVYPPIAAAARVEGTVTLAAIISPLGSVESILPSHSIPLLDQAAIDAVKQWQFAPFVTGGSPARVAAEIDVPFYLEQGTGRLAGEVREKSRDCRALLDAHRYDDAQPVCASAANLAARLPATDRADAYHLAGHMLIARNQLPDAIEAFSAEVKLRQPGTYSDRMPTALQSLALAYGKNNDIKNARKQFDRAEKAAREYGRSVDDMIKYVHADADIARILTGNARTILRSVLSDYVDSLRAAGLADEAARVDARLRDVSGG